eukprot:COSAG05_NODE_198_length_14502_cov_41.134416_9_plen_995_part_00
MAQSEDGAKFTDPLPIGLHTKGTTENVRSCGSSANNILHLNRTAAAKAKVGFRKGGSWTLRKGNKIGSVNLPTDFSVSFGLTPTRKIGGWANILHVTGTGGNCCRYGDRIPAIWFYPRTTRFNMIDGHKRVGNDECPIRQQLPLNKRTAVKIILLLTQCSVYFNGKKMCTEARADRKHFNKAQVWAADPWHNVAAAKMDNLVIKSGATGMLDKAQCRYPGGELRVEPVSGGRCPFTTGLPHDGRCFAQCSNETRLPLTCFNGTRNQPNRCCTSGMSWSGVNSSHCVRCVAGRVDHDSDPSTACRLCPAGRFAHIGSAQCEPCASGTHSLAGASTCDHCSGRLHCRANHTCQASAPGNVGRCVRCTTRCGCTNPIAANYDPSAKQDDGSCDYLSMCKSKQWRCAPTKVPAACLDGQCFSKDYQRHSRITLKGGSMLSFAVRYVHFYAIRVVARGGAIETTRRILHVWNTLFSYNTALAGGAIYSDHSDVKIRMSRFLKNKEGGNVWSQGSGGAIVAVGGSLSVELSEFVGNQVKEAYTTQLHGGAIHATSAIVTLRSTLFAKNSAVHNGGGLWASDSALTLEYVLFNENDAAAGGGMFVSSCSLTLVASAFNYNHGHSHSGHHVNALNMKYVKVFGTNFQPFVDKEATSVQIGGVLAGCEQHPCQRGHSCTYKAYSLSCQACPPNTVGLDGVTCEACHAGTGPTKERTMCTSCSAGSYSQFGVCQRCARPNIVVAHGTSCTPPFRCPPGTMCTATTGDCSYDSAAKNNCTACPIGTVRSSGTACTRCTDPGKIMNTKRTACESCPGGTGPSADRGVCVPCSNTTFSTFGIACQECSEPNVVNSKHTACRSPFICPPGTECPTGVKCAPDVVPEQLYHVSSRYGTFNGLGNKVHPLRHSWTGGQCQTDRVWLVCCGHRTLGRPRFVRTLQWNKFFEFWCGMPGMCGAECSQRTSANLVYSVSTRHRANCGTYCLYAVSCWYVQRIRCLSKVPCWVH